MKTIAVYYSDKGSNRFLASKAADALGCETAELKPRIGSGGPRLMATLTGLSSGIKKGRSGGDEHPVERGKFQRRD